MVFISRLGLDLTEHVVKFMKLELASSSEHFVERKLKLKRTHDYVLWAFPRHRKIAYASKCSSSAHGLRRKRSQHSLRSSHSSPKWKSGNSILGTDQSQLFAGTRLYSNHAS